MKKILLFCSILALAAPSLGASEVTTHKLPVKTNRQKAAKHADSPRQLMAKAHEAQAGQWWAQTEDYYYFDDWENAWNYGRKDHYTYTPTGKIATWVMEDIMDGETMAYYRTTYTYNENDMEVKRVEETSYDNENYTLTQETLIAYDPIITDLIISNEEYIYLEDYDEPLPGNCYKRNITRDENGNITLCEIAVLYDGIYDPTDRLTVEYGSDGKPSSIASSTLWLDYETNEFYWQDGQQLTNLTWETTNGQIYSIDRIYGPDNKMLSADINDSGISMTCVVEYTADGGFTSTMTGTDEDAFTATQTYKEYEYGGYYSKSYVEYEDGYTYEGEVEMTFAYNGLMTREYYLDIEDGEIWVEEYKGTFSGDENKPDSYLYSYYDYWEDEWYDMAKIDFSDYEFIAATGVDNMTRDADAATEYFNLQGIRIAEPVKGQICIKRTGDKIQKIMAK